MTTRLLEAKNPSDHLSQILVFGGTPAEREALRSRVVAAGGEGQHLDLLFPTEGCVALAVPAALSGGLLRELEAAGLRVEDASRPIAAQRAEEEVP